METKHLKKYAPEARRDFIAAVKNKAAVYGLLRKEILPMQEEGDVVIIGDRPFPRAVAKQRKELEARIRKEGFQQFMVQPEQLDAILDRLENARQRIYK